MIQRKQGHAYKLTRGRHTKHSTLIIGQILKSEAHVQTIAWNAIFHSFTILYKFPVNYPKHPSRVEFLISTIYLSLFIFPLHNRLSHNFS